MPYKPRIDDDLDYYETGSPVYVTDEKVRITDTDTTSDFLNNKLVAGSNITLVTSGLGGDEKLVISSSGTGGAGLVSSVFTRVGDVVSETDDYTWAQIDKTTSDILDITTRNHSGLTNIGTNTHTEIDSHITDTSIHFTDGSIVHMYGNETISGVKTFNEFPLCESTPNSKFQLINKDYVDGFVQGLVAKDACRAASVDAMELHDLITVDGVEIVSGNRILVKNMEDPILNGIYGAVIGSWDRTTDYDADAEVKAGTYTIILEGDVNANTQWLQYETDPKVGGSPINFRALPQIEAYTASKGVTKVEYDFQSALTYSGLSLVNGSLFTPTDNSTIKLTNGSLYVPTSGITNTQLAGSINITKLQYGSSNQILATNNAGSEIIFKDLLAGDNMTITQTGSGITFASTGGSGTSSDYMYITEPFLHHPTYGFTWNNMPEVLSEAASALRRKVNLTGVQEYRIVTTQAIAGGDNAKFRLRYSLNNSTYSDIGNEGNSGDLSVGAGTGVKVGAWEDLVSEAKDDVWLTMYGYSGNGIADPQWRQLEVQLKVNPTIVNIGSSSIMTKEMSFISTPSTSNVWTNMPSGGRTEFLGNEYSRKKIDLTGTTQYRIGVNQSVAGAANSLLDAEYSLDDSTFYQLESTSGAGEVNVGIGTGVKYSSWADIVAGARQDCWLRLIGMSGDQVADPAFRQAWIEFKQYINTSGLGGAGSVYLFSQPLENDGTGSIWLRYGDGLDVSNGSLIATGSGGTGSTYRFITPLVDTTGSVTLPYGSGLSVSNGSLIVNGSQINHFNLSNIGTNTHIAIDTHLQSELWHTPSGANLGELYQCSGTGTPSEANRVVVLDPGASGTLLQSDGTWAKWTNINKFDTCLAPIEAINTSGIGFRYTGSLTLTNGSLSLSSALWQPSGAYQSSGLYQASGLYQPSGLYQASGLYAPSGAYQTSGNYISSGLYLTQYIEASDHGNGSIAQIISVCYGTGSTPPNASGTSEGALYIQYTA